MSKLDAANNFLSRIFNLKCAYLVYKFIGFSQKSVLLLSKSFEENQCSGCSCNIKHLLGRNYNLYKLTKIDETGQFQKASWPISFRLSKIDKRVLLWSWRKGRIRKQDTPHGMFSKFFKAMEAIRGKFMENQISTAQWSERQNNDILIVCDTLQIH